MVKTVTKATSEKMVILVTNVTMVITVTTVNTRTLASGTQVNNGGISNHSNHRNIDKFGNQGNNCDKSNHHNHRPLVAMLP